MGKNTSIKIIKNGKSKKLIGKYVDTMCPNIRCKDNSMCGGKIDNEPIDTIYELRCSYCKYKWQGTEEGL